MPVFEYRCHACGRRFPWLEGVIDDRAECVCPHCGGREVSRLISRFAVNRSEDEDLELGDDDLGDDAEGEGGLDDEFADEEDEE
jgi:putative FmdB family regulatory protein